MGTTGREAQVVASRVPWPSLAWVIRALVVLFGAHVPRLLRTRCPAPEHRWSCWSKAEIVSSGLVLVFRLLLKSWRAGLRWSSEGSSFSAEGMWGGGAQGNSSGLERKVEPLAVSVLYLLLSESLLGSKLIQPHFFGFQFPFRGKKSRIHKPPNLKFFFPEINIDLEGGRHHKMYFIYWNQGSF